MNLLYKLVTNIAKRKGIRTLKNEIVLIQMFVA